MIRLCTSLLVFACVLALAAPASANLPNEGLVCARDDPVMDESEVLRAWSLQLRGYPPSVNEYHAIETGETNPDELLDLWLESEDFAEQSVRFHRNHFWPNITNVNLFNASFSFRREAGSLPYWRINVGTIYRGGPVPCLDQPAEFDGGQIITWEQEDGTHLEGYVLVNPYWAPETTIKVCAFDARATLNAPDGTSCKSRVGLTRAECGCGPELKWCATNETATAMRDALGVAVDVAVERLIAEERPYTDLFLKNIAYFNGPLAHYWTHVAQRYDLYPANANVVPVGLISDIPYGDVDVWKAVELAPQHAGVLTSPVYLMRFTSNRRRGRRYIEALLNQPFVPPAGGLDIDSEASPEPDTTAKDGCKYCHAILEPAAEHWGRWTEFAMQYLPPESYPPCRADCQLCAYTGGCSEDCETNYVTQGALTKETLYYGWLKPYQFNVEGALLDEIAAEAEATKVQCEPGLVAQAELDHIELGPKNFVKMTIVDDHGYRRRVRTIGHQFRTPSIQGQRTAL